MSIISTVNELIEDSSDYKRWLRLNGRYNVGNPQKRDDHPLKRWLESLHPDVQVTFHDSKSFTFYIDADNFIITPYPHWMVDHMNKMVDWGQSYILGDWVLAWFL